MQKSTSLEEIRQVIGKLREQKGKEKQTLELINEALSFGHDFVANLFFEEALTYQHLKSVSEMEKAVLKAKFYIDKYKLINLKPRLFTFLGKVEELNSRFNKAIVNYKRSLFIHKKAGNSIEVLGHLSYSMIMNGQTDAGYKLAKSTYKKFFDSEVGMKLEKNDYSTWAIWMSGVTIRTVNALIAKKVSFNKQEIEKWIKNTE